MTGTGASEEHAAGASMTPAGRNRNENSNA